MVFNPDLVPHLGYISNGDYVTYNVNFNPYGTNYRINFLYALSGKNDRDGGTWEARLGGVDGEIIGTYQPLPTDSDDWYTFVEDKFSLQRTNGEPLEGDKITFVARTGRYLMNFGWFEIGYVEDLNIPTNSPTTQPTNQPTNAPTNVSTYVEALIEIGISYETFALTWLLFCSHSLKYL